MPLRIEDSPSKTLLKHEELKPEERLTGRWANAELKRVSQVAAILGLVVASLGSLSHGIAAANTHQLISERGASVISGLESTIDRTLWVGREGIALSARKEQEADLSARLSDVVEGSRGKILAISVIDRTTRNPNQQFLVAQSTPTQLAVSQDGPPVLDEESGLWVANGTLSGQRIRRFDKPIALDPHAPGNYLLTEAEGVTPYVSVFVRAEAPNPTWLRLALLGLCLAVAAGLLAFLSFATQDAGSAPQPQR